jgi:hypothetical protein
VTAVSSELAFLFRTLKAPAAARALPKRAERARQEEWSYERFAEALLATEVASRDAHGGQSRIKQARFPARKTLEEFDFSFQRSVQKTLVLHLGQLDFLTAKDNVVLLGPPRTGKTHLAIALGIRGCLAGQRVAFATATEWVARLGDAQRQMWTGMPCYGSSVSPWPLRNCHPRGSSSSWETSRMGHPSSITWRVVEITRPLGESNISPRLHGPRLPECSPLTPEGGRSTRRRSRLQLRTC